MKTFDEFLSEAFVNYRLTNNDKIIELNIGRKPGDNFIILNGKENPNFKIVSVNEYDLIVVSKTNVAIYERRSGAVFDFVLRPDEIAALKKYI